MTATAWMNYPGNRLGQIGRVMGPNTFDEMLRVVEETYDEDTDKTRLGFSYISNIPNTPNIDLG